MKLLYRIILRLSLPLTLVLIGWGVLFYITILLEINDEVDDNLEDYSENIIIKALSGQPLPSQSDGTNNFYYITEVTETYADTTPHIQYFDQDFYINYKKENEPARVLKTIFKNRQGQYFELTVSTPTIEKSDLQEAILNWIIILYLVLLILILIIMTWGFYRSMQPLYILLRWIEQYTIGKQHPLPAIKTEVTEFKQLYKATQQSVQRNQIIFEQQKQFIGNASHELQTPLAICQNRLEMLAEGENLTEEQLSEISKTLETISYLIRLNKSLLLLFKIENTPFQDHKEIQINTLIHKQLDDYQDIFSYKNIQIDIKEEDQLIVNMSEILATTLISNLLKNAYIHNIQGGNISISINNKQLIFSNTGLSKALDTEKMFQQFYQGENAPQGCTGLGLSIAKAICQIYHIQLHYHYSNQHQFELNF